MKESWTRFMDKNKKMINGVIIFLMTWSMVIVSGFSAFNFYAIFFLFGSAGLIYLADRCATELESKNNRLIFAYAIILAFLYSSVGYANWTASLDNKFFKQIIGFIAFSGLVCILFFTLKIIYGLFDRYAVKSDESNKGSAFGRFFCKHIFVISMILCFVAWFPYFLHLYPGVMTPDSVNQLEQAMGMQRYSNHHPWVHTLLIKYTYKLGKMIGGSNNAGVACYTLTQMLICSTAVGFILDTLNRIKVRTGFLVASIIFFALVPFNGVFAVTMWKDIIFGYIVVCFNCVLIRILILKEEKMYIAMGLLGIAVCLFRSNGWYGFILTSVILGFYFIKTHKNIKYVLALAVAILVSGLVRGPVMKHFDVIQPDFVESVSLPLQQVARVLVNKEFLYQNETDLIEKVIDTTYVDKLYDETFSDNIKELVRAGNPDYLANHKKDFLKLYLKLGLRYPNVYLSAFIGQAGGYWYPDTLHSIANVEGISSNECGVYANPLIGGKLIVKAKEIWIKLGGMVPIYGLLWSTGSVVWMFLIFIGYLILHKKLCKIMVLTPTICLFATVLIATPVSGDFRYIYYMVLALPLFGIEFTKTR